MKTLAGNKKKLLFILLPIPLIISTSLVFHFSTIFFGKDSGYLIGFLFYWLFWCLIVPILFRGRQFFSLLSDKNSLFQKRNWWIILLLASTVVAPVFIYFIPNISDTPLKVILLAVPFALFHGFCEELFWRGLYISFFPEDFYMGVLFPTLLFSLWHIAPQFSIMDNTPIIFLISTIPLGFTYSLVAYKTKSAKWSAISHGISGIFAFSGFLASSFYNIFFS